MTATQQFIEDAIKGGYIATMCVELEKNWPWYIHQVLLDPLAWRAVGNTRGWKKIHHDDMEGNYDECWKCQMHTFIDYLADGKTIEEALQAIE